MRDRFGKFVNGFINALKSEDWIQKHVADVGPDSVAKITGGKVNESGDVVVTYGTAKIRVEKKRALRRAGFALKEIWRNDPWSIVYEVSQGGNIICKLKFEEADNEQ